MKAIVFGGSGFLGSHVADELNEKGYEVIVFDRRESDYLQENQAMFVGDILDKQQVSDAVKGCDVVYNFAGMADIDQAIKEPLETIKSNVMGNTNILEACREHNVKRFVFASSIYVYTNLASFYRSSKQACELIIEDYQKVFGLDYTILRYGSLYGRRSNEFNFIYQVVKQAVESGKVTRMGDGQEVRDYIHVQDAARSSVEILCDEFKNQHVIITGTQSIKVRDLLSMVKEIFQDKITIDYLPQEDEHYRYALTPYTFEPKLAKKLVLNHYHDLGQGILDVIHEVHQQSDQTSELLDEVKTLLDTP